PWRSRRAQGPGRRRGRHAEYSTHIRSPPAPVLAARNARARGCRVPFGSSRASILPRTAAIVAAPRTGVMGLDRLGAGLLGLDTVVFGLAAGVLDVGADLLGLAGLGPDRLGAGPLGLDIAFEREPGLDEEAGGRPEGAARHLARTERGLSPGHVGRPSSSDTP